MKKQILLTILALALLPQFASAQDEKSDRAGGGGHTSCAAYSDLAGRIASTLVTIGQEKIDSINAVIRANEVWNAKRNLKCIPAENLDREAWSDPVTGVTMLLIKSTLSEAKGLIVFDDRSAEKKIRLVAHELAVLAKFENDGEYFISEAMVSIMRKFSINFRTILPEGVGGSQVIENENGTLTIMDPFFKAKDGKVFRFYYSSDHDDRQGLCKFLGFRQTYDMGGVLASRLMQFTGRRTFVHSYWNIQKIYRLVAIRIGREGHIIEIVDKETTLDSTHFVNLVTCK